MYKGVLGTLLLAASLMLPALAPAVSIGLPDDFEDGTTQNWVVGLRGGVPRFPPVNVPTGGPAGDGDHYLLLTSVASIFSDPGNRLVVINLTQWTGDFLGAAVNFITMDVNNLGATDLDLRIRVEDPDAPPSNTPTHIAVSTDAVFVPAGGGWTRVVFPMSPGHLTPLKGDVALALSNVAELRIFHSPTATFPGPTIDAQLGVDNITARVTSMPPQGDSDGDGKTDIGVWRPGDGYWYILRSSDGGLTQTQWGTGTLFANSDVPGPGDYDGDGKTDLAVWRPSDGIWYILRSSDGGVIQTQWGSATLFLNSDILTPGDYDGDGKTDIAVWRPGDGVWYILRSSDGGVTQTQWGTGTLFPNPDVPVPGDFDGDRKTDTAVWRPGDGNWYILRSSDGGVIQTQWGTGSLNDVPVPGDYDGDGKTDYAVWRPGDGNWYIIRSSDSGIIQTQWGTLGDIPTPGDYDGDGKIDMAVWRPSGGNWYILRSSDGGVTLTQWGASVLNDIPISQ